MDPATIAAILQRQGARDTPENVNQILQFAASNPDILERYGMGLAPGLDDNSALLRLALDKSIAATDGVKAEPLPAPPMPTNGNGAPRAPAAPARQNKTYPNPNEASGSPTQQYIPGDFNAPQPSKPTMSGMVNEQGVPVEYAQAPGGSFDLTNLLPALGITSVAGQQAITRGRGAGAGAPNQLPTTRTMPTPTQLATPNAPAQPQARGRGVGAGGATAPAPYATDTPTTPQGPVRPTRSTEGAPAPYATDPTDPATKAALQAEIDADNARALQEQLKAQKQRETAATLKAGARAVRGR